jgi:peptide/nickel transport system substrate-binding protein
MGSRISRILRRVILGLTLLGITACTPGVPAPVALPTPTPTPTAPAVLRGAGGTLRLIYWQAPTSLNPQLSAALKDLEAARLTYEPLASYDRNGSLVPFLAAEIPDLQNGGLDPEGRWVIWQLKRDVLWSDGEPFTADDVRFTYEYITDPLVGAANVTDYALISSVEVIDDYSIKINFKEPTVAWAQPFVGFQGMILPRHIFAPYQGSNARSAPANNQPVGTGPYRVVGGIRPQEVLLLGNELVETNKIVFEPNPYFREADKPHFSRVELRGGGTVGAAAEAVFEAGLADFAYNLAIPAAELEELAAGGTGRLVANPVARMELLFVNFSDPNQETAEGERSARSVPHPIFSDSRVRQALVYAIDRRQIVALFGQAGSAIANILVAPPEYVSPNTTITFDLERAATLLDEAGWQDSDGDGVRDQDGRPLQLVLQGPNNATTQQIQEIIYNELSTLGIDVRVKPVDPSVYYTRDPANPNTALHFYADLEQATFTNVSPDPTAFMQHWTCNQIPQQADGWSAGLNLGRWCNSEYDRLFEQAQTTLDPEQRRAIFIQMNDLLIADVAVIPLVQIAQINGVSSTLSGVDPTPWDASVWNIKDWK